MRKLLAGWLLATAGVAVVTAAPSTPGDVVESAMRRVLAAVASPEESTADGRRAAIRRIVGGILDFEEMSRRALGAHWAALSPAQQEEFVDLFRRLLEGSYLTRIEAYGAHTLQFVGETVVGDDAVVAWTMGAPLPAAASESPGFRRTVVEIEYRLHRRDDGWRVYDLVINGMGLVDIFQRQFTRVLKTDSYETLVERLRRKTEDLGTARERR
jgi:phospholipid transport system substrate-binding protein